MVRKELQLQTKILNTEEIGFNKLMLMFGKVYGIKCNKLGGIRDAPQKLNIIRVIVIKDNTKTESTIWSRLGLDKPIKHINADVDIYVQDKEGNNSVIQINSSDVKLLKVIMKYVWELNADPRVKFYKKMKHVELNKEQWDTTQL